MYLTVFLRRRIYYWSPKSLQMLTAMEETPRTLKGKHGAILEHSLFWIFFVYFFWISLSTVPFYSKNTVVITDANSTTITGITSCIGSSQS
jgi:hypothetical protein